MSRPTISPTRVVVFDVDDTLYLERDYVHSGFRAVGAWAREALGLPDLAERAWVAFEEGVRGRIFDAALAGAGIEPTSELIAELVACYRNHPPDIRLLGDARTCLEGLALDPDVAVAVLTDGPLASQRAKAESLGLATWTRHVLFTEALGAGFSKPHTRAFELVEERLGVSGERCAYIADNPAKDFAAPRQLGWATVRIRRPRGLYFEAASGGDVDHEAADLADLVRLLARRAP